MKHKISLWLIFNLFFLAITSLTSFADDSANVYRIHEGDALNISVWGEEALHQKDLRVLPDGSVSLPLAGRLAVSGLSTNEVETIITDKLKKFLADPKVTVTVSATDGDQAFNRAYILGKVTKPGPIQISPNMTILQALSLAGGLEKFADLDGIKVLRNQGSAQKMIPVHYDKILHGQDMETNITLSPGDVILVP